MILRAAIDSFAAVLFPAPCRICGATLLTASRIPICAACFAWFEPIQQPMCARWGRPFPPLKQEEVTRLGLIGSPRLAEVVAHEREQFGADVVVPVPLHPDRDHNQAELIARPLARHLHLKQGAYPLARTKRRPARLVLPRKDQRDSGTWRVRYSEGPAG